jgi:hypothetical protein
MDLFWNDPFQMSIKAAIRALCGYSYWSMAPDSSVFSTAFSELAGSILGKGIACMQSETRLGPV